ncbi:MAG: sensor histidine kinase [Candidatus Binataceae bacterium]
MDERDRIIADLREAVKARDDFLAIVVHELRNPLNPIQIYLQLIRSAEKAGDRGRFSTYLDRLEALVDRFLKRSGLLLEVSRITSAGLQLNHSRVNLSKLIIETVTDYEPLLARSGSKIALDIPPDVIGSLDALGAVEIVDNLLSNAIKYGSGKPIEIKLAVESDTARITVRDHGMGIADEDRQRIFNRFERVIRSEPRAGFGIGLWVARRLAEGMGGEITVQSKKAAGSVFTVVLPLGDRKSDEQ